MEALLNLQAQKARVFIANLTKFATPILDTNSEPSLPISRLNKLNSSQ